MLKAFRQVYLGNDILQRLQSNVADSLNRLLSVLILDGRVVEVSLVGGVEKAIDHKLGRKPEGWMIIDKDADTSVYRSSDSTNQFLHLTSANNVNLKLWVF